MTFPGDPFGTPFIQQILDDIGSVLPPGFTASFGTEEIPITGPPPEPLHEGPDQPAERLCSAILGGVVGEFRDLDGSTWDGVVLDLCTVRRPCRTHPEPATPIGAT